MITPHRTRAIPFFTDVHAKWGTRVEPLFLGLSIPVPLVSPGELDKYLSDLTLSKATRQPGILPFSAHTQPALLPTSSLLGRR